MVIILFVQVTLSIVVRPRIRMSTLSFSIFRIILTNRVAYLMVRRSLKEITARHLVRFQEVFNINFAVLLPFLLRYAMQARP